MKKLVLFAGFLLSTVVSYNIAATEEKFDMPVSLKVRGARADIDGTLTITTAQPTVNQTTETVSVVVPSVKEETTTEQVLVPVDVPVTTVTPTAELVEVQVPETVIDDNNAAAQTTSVSVNAAVEIDPATGLPVVTPAVPVNEPAVEPAATEIPVEPTATELPVEPTATELPVEPAPVLNTPVEILV